MNPLPTYTAEPGLQRAKPGRECGRCSACCTLIGVGELGKPERTPCAHLAPGGRGCGCYATRPESCRSYVCLWLAGFGGSDDRPDRTGVMFDVTQIREGQQQKLVAWELRRGASRSARPMSVLQQQLAKGIAVVVIDPDGVRTLYERTLDRADGRWLP